MSCSNTGRTLCLKRKWKCEVISRRWKVWWLKCELHFSHRCSSLQHFNFSSPHNSNQWAGARRQHTLMMCTQGALTLLCHTLSHLFVCLFLNISPANYYFMHCLAECASARLVEAQAKVWTKAIRRRKRKCREEWEQKDSLKGNYLFCRCTNNCSPA